MTILLLAAMAALALAPLLMPDSYSVRAHSVSESAAQGVDGAWLARLGFLLFGFAVISLAFTPGSTWARWGRRAHAGFGVSMIAAALVIPLLMANVDGSGLVQRIMFLVAFLRYGLETVRGPGANPGNTVTLSTDAMQWRRSN